MAFVEDVLGGECDSGANNVGSGSDAQGSSEFGVGVSSGGIMRLMICFTWVLLGFRMPKMMKGDA